MFFRNSTAKDIPQFPGVEAEKMSSTSLINVLKTAIKLAVMAAIMAYLYSKGLLDFRKVHAVFTNPGIVAFGLAVVFLTATAAVTRWKLLLEGQGISISFIEAFKLT